MAFIILFFRSLFNQKLLLDVQDKVVHLIISLTIIAGPLFFNVAFLIVLLSCGMHYHLLSNPYILC